MTTKTERKFYSENLKYLKMKCKKYMELSIAEPHHYWRELQLENAFTSDRKSTIATEGAHLKH